MVTKNKPTPVELHMTGEAFLQLIEQITEDGKINTLPELIDFLKSVPQGTTLEAYVASKTANLIDDKMASRSDIDEIFHEQNVEH